MLVEKGKEAVFYASFETPEGTPAILVTAPLLELFLENKSVFKSKMIKTEKRFFLKKKIDLLPGKYLTVYSGIDQDNETLRGEELLEVIGPIFTKEDAASLNKEINSIRKIFKAECTGIVQKVKGLKEDGAIIKKMLAKILPTEKIEELKRENK